MLTDDLPSDPDGFIACSGFEGSGFFSCLADEGRYLHAHGKYTTASKYRHGDIWDNKRHEIHLAIFESLKARYIDVPCKGKAIFIGGESGVGKTSFRKSAKGIEGNYVISDTDIIRRFFIQELIARDLMPEQDKRFEKYLKRPAKPLELSGLFHEEAQVISGKFEEWAILQSKNIVFDTSLANREFTFLRLEQLHEQNYKVVGILIQCDPEIANDRRLRRYEEEASYSEGLGGRPIPREFAELVRKKAPVVFREARDTEHGFSASLLLDSSESTPKLISAWRGKALLENVPDLGQLDFSPQPSLVLQSELAVFL